MLNQNLTPIFIPSILSIMIMMKVFFLRKRDIFITIWLENRNKTFIRPKKLEAYKILKQILNYSSTFRYVYHNVGLFHRLAQFFLDESNNNRANSKYQPANRIKVKNGLSIILDSLNFLTKSKVLFEVDGNRNDIYENNNLGSVNLFKVDFLDLLKIKKLKFINLQNTFENDYDMNKVKFNSSEDYHWNAYRHETVSDEIENYINKNR